jgi:syntaxin-binding protein 5
VFKPASHKGASKDFDDNVLCDAASITEVETRGRAIVAVFGDRTARAYSIPALKEIGHASISMTDPARSNQAVVMPTGNIFVWSGPSELAMLDSWGAGRPLRPSNDLLINLELAVPPRPTISNLQWLSGTQYISPTDLDLLIGGPDRPPSKRMMAADAAEKLTARSAAASTSVGGGAGGGAQAGGQNEGWGEYLTRQLNERTEKLNIMGDNMDNLSNESQGWADDVSKYMNKQKRNAAMGYVSGKFF